MTGRLYSTLLLKVEQLYSHISLLRALSSDLKTSKDRDPTTSLDNLLQYLMNAFSPACYPFMVSQLRPSSLIPWLGIKGKSLALFGTCFFGSERQDSPKTTSSRLKNISIKAASHILWHLGHPGCFHWICSSLLKFHRHLLLNTFRTATPEFSFSLPLPLQIHDFGQSSLHSPTASVKVEGLNNASHLGR